MKEKLKLETSTPNFEVPKMQSYVDQKLIRDQRKDFNINHERLSDNEIPQVSKAKQVWDKLKNYVVKSAQSEKLPEILEFEEALETTTESDIESYRIELQKINEALQNPNNSSSKNEKLYTDQRELYLMISQINARISSKSAGNKDIKPKLSNELSKTTVDPKQKGGFVNIHNSTKLEKVISKYSEYKDKLQKLLKINKPVEMIINVTKPERTDQELAESLQKRKKQSNSEIFTSDKSFNNITSFTRPKDPFRYANPRQGGIPMKRQKTAGSAN